MVFVDGTNLFYRLEAARLRVQLLRAVLNYFIGGRQLLRTYLYTIAEQLERAKTIHGDNFLSGVRVVLGHGIPTGDGNVKEKGVDAMLVADLVYHAAAKNLDYAVVVTTDTDFAVALERVEDFGCRTAVASVCAPIPNRLTSSCDDVLTVDADLCVSSHWGTRY